MNIKVFNASNFGVPQNRERVFIIGTKIFTKDIYPSGKKQVISTREAIGDLDFLDASEFSTSYQKPIGSEYQKVMRVDTNILFNHKVANHTKTVIDRFSYLNKG
ncbi:MAG: DNA cytosine methyltransferase [DPANN group archaeon]|nr:DNA cytosine methyltransferase [DPANN group archaeon]